MRVGRFLARDFAQLEAGAAQVPWFDFVQPGQRVRFAVTSRQSSLYHTDAVAERLARYFNRELGDGDDAQLFVVRIDHDRCTVSVDSSGPPLHERGYRRATAKAPLRPTVAAAVVLASGWDRRAPFVDPLCGAGTIAIEAALLASGKAPGADRRFAFEDWPSFEPGTWASARTTLDAPPTGAPVVFASDRDAGAVAATAANATRAGVGAVVSGRELPLSAAADWARDLGSGWLVTNPPYGKRIGDRRTLRDLYLTIGRLATKPFATWTIGLLTESASPLIRATKLDVAPALRTKNGGIDVTLWLRRSVDEAHLPALREQDAGGGPDPGVLVDEAAE